MPDESKRSKVRRVGRGVIAVLTRHDRVLLIRRAAGIRRGGCWCFPGGHVEAGENSRRAIQRELREELGIESVARQRLGSVRVGAEYILAVWQVEHVAGLLEPDPAEVGEMRWMKLEEIHGLPDGLASNQHVVELLRGVMRSSR